MALSPGAIQARSLLFKQIRERFPTKDQRARLFSDKIWTYATDEELREVLGLAKKPVAEKAQNKHEPVASGGRKTAPDNKSAIGEFEKSLKKLGLSDTGAIKLAHAVRTEVGGIIADQKARGKPLSPEQIEQLTAESVAEHFNRMTGQQIKKLHATTQYIQKELGLSNVQAIALETAAKKATKEKIAALRSKGLKPDKQAIMKVSVSEINKELSKLGFKQRLTLEGSFAIPKKAQEKAKPKQPRTYQDFINAGESVIPKKLSSELDKLHKQLSEIEKGDTSAAIAVELYHELQEARQGRGSRSEAEIIAEGRVYKQKFEQAKKITQEAEKAAESFRQKLIDESSISQEQADKLASSIKINKEAADVVSEKELRAQASEFYRLMGGKGAESIRSFTKDSDRASANPEKGTVNIGNSAKKSILFHEMAHHFEYNRKELAESSVGWIQSRATGKIAKLKDLTGNENYRETEVALPDKFLNPYVGKVYRDSQGKIKPATEVISMGVERFSDPRSMVRFYLQDPEHFKFTLGAIRHA